MTNGTGARADVTSTPWLVPDDLRARMTAPDQQAWVTALPQVAAELADRWEVVPVAAAWSGFWSAVWPVVDPAGRPLALKITTGGDGREHEAAALRRWGGRGAVRLERHDPTVDALLLERLDGDRPLQVHPDVDAATMIIADLLADLDGLPAPPGLRSLATVARAMITDIEGDPHHDQVPARDVGRALETLCWLETVPSEQCSLVHGDCHFANVLPTLAGTEPARWAAIDPLPFAGVPELEPVAMLRNRFEDALATGDPDRALRRRVDVIADRTGTDAALVRRLSQAVAVQNLPFLLAEHPDHAFAGPYALISRW